MIRARAPLRISFAGGGTDVSPYCDERGGAVVCSTIDKFAYATVTGYNKFLVHSIDYDQTIEFDIDEKILYDGQLDLAKAVIEYYRDNYEFKIGVKMFLHNDAPPGSGLGSSSAIVVAMIKAMNKYKRIYMDEHQVANLALDIERNKVGIKGGRQDQFSSTFGGFNFIEFYKDNVTIVNPLVVHQETVCELEYGLIFAYVGGTRMSSDIIGKMVNNYHTLKEATKAMDNLKTLAYLMKEALLIGNLEEFGCLLDESWNQKKKMADVISNAWIDEVYSEAKKAGALGGKITGAGGGGFIFFFCDPLHKFDVQKRLKEMGVQIINLKFVEEGALTWLAR